MGLLHARVAADGGFSIVDNVTFNGSTTTPIDTRYGGKLKPGLLCVRKRAFLVEVWPGGSTSPPGCITAEFTGALGVCGAATFLATRSWQRRGLHDRQPAHQCENTTVRRSAPM